MSRSSFSCYLIGDDHLLIQCAETLLSQRHHILGIISSFSDTKDWALKNKIACFDSISTAEHAISENSFDYLFSIINGSILPAHLLSLASKMSINYHNSLLPRYAGAHAPAWAILNNESSHGITWHIMSENIDAGDILKQSSIKIDAHETGLSLSVKCYQHALSTFDDLIVDLASHTISSKPQNLNNRTYYDFNQKPIGNGWITWNSTAESIDRILRALDLGQYHHNRLASPKFILGDTIYILKKHHLLNEISAAPPGTILEIHENSLKIATKTNTISIEQIKTLSGEDCILSNLARDLELRVGHCLYSPSDIQQEALEKISHAYAKYETFWVKQLEIFNPAIIPFQPLIQLQHVEHSLTCLTTFQLNEPIIKHQGESLSSSKSITNFLLTAVVIYLYRLGNENNNGFIFKDEQTNNANNSPAFFSNALPFSIPLQHELCFEETLAMVTNHRALLKSRQTYSKDVFFRYPDLSQDFLHQLSITIMIENEEQSRHEQLNSLQTNILIYISAKDKRIDWYINDQLKNKDENLLSIIKNSSNHLNVLCHSILTNPNQSISTLPLLTSQERSKIINEWNHTDQNTTTKKNIVELFEEQVNKTPHGVAVSYINHSMTYQELNRQANQLARFLQKNGLQHTTFGAISTDQELFLIIGILAILKAGAAYIPIDPTYPKKHIQYILNDSKPTIIMASKKLHTKIQLFCSEQKLSLVYFENILESIQNESTENLTTVPIKPYYLAYLIYTSGTTGEPKGVMIPHQAVTRLVKNTNYINITPKDNIAQAASISFDAATFEIWGALLNGAQLISVPHSTLIHINEFGELLRIKNISILWMTSALFNQYAAIDPSIFKHLTYLLVGGDVLNSERIFNVIDCIEGAPRHVLNGYGPTENTTFTTIYPICKSRRNYTIPIGKPITQTTVYILDRHLKPVPMGAPGELYTGGEGLATGYLNRDELTTKRFIANPFSNEKTMLYCTGDTVRWMPDGNIDYIGREDNQIKIRGFRIELEAIQAHLLHHPEIDQCAVRAHEHNHTKVLVAYIASKRLIPSSDIHDFLAQQLPEYMIPKHIIFLHEMPLTLNGKINYKKLPKPDFKQSSSTEEYVKPRTNIEIKLEKLWCNLFSMEEISIRDSFFDLGGHSLLITTLLIKLKNSFGFDMVLHEFLEKPTIEHLAELIDIPDKNDQSTTLNQLMQSDLNLPIKVNIAKLMSYTNPPKSILLTGVTGFLGAHLLNDLYHLTDAKIYCLLRCDNDDLNKRMDGTLNNYKINLPNKKRVIPLKGDLSLPNLGLDPTLFLKLADEIDLIYHNGAAVHHLYNYDLLRAANVLSTHEIIKFASLSKVKPIHYISTLSAASNHLDEQNAIIESLIPLNIASSPPSDGYSQTKWVAEQLLSNAANSGLPINVYRPGWILGHSLTGSIAAEKNHLLMLIKGCIQLKSAPNWDITLDILPVDIISELIIRISLTNNIDTKAFNMINPNGISWIDLINYLNNRGYSIDLVPANEWKNIHLKKIDKNNALYALYALYVNISDSDWMKGLSNISGANNHNTFKAFKEHQLRPPLINEQLLGVYFDYLEQEGFI